MAVPGWCVKNIIFGTEVLNRPPYTVESLAIYDAPSRNLKQYPRLERPGSILSQRRWEAKTIEIAGRVVAANQNGSVLSKSSLETSLDRLKRIIASGPQLMYPGYDDERYFPAAELQDDIKIGWDIVQNPKEVSWRAKFFCQDPFMQGPLVTAVNTVRSLLLYAGVTYQITEAYSIEGSAPAFPLINIVLATAGVTGIWIENQTMGLRITITKAFSIGDNIYIDTAAQSVLVNGVETDFGGAFPEVDPTLGDNTFIWGASLGTGPVPTMLTSLTYNKKWL